MGRNEYGFYIEIRKNDEPIAELQVEEVHDATINYKGTLNSCGKFTFKNGDKITARLISRANGEDKKGKYTVDSTITVERVAIF